MIRNAIQRFMYGRYGNDPLNLFLMGLYLLLYLVFLFVRLALLYWVSFVLLACVLFRMLSRNIDRRRAENAKFLNWWQPIKNRFAAARQRRQDKEHKYFVCKGCKTICRVPAGKGKVEITCPKCGGEII